MERLSGADAWYLYLEGPTIHLHVTGVLMLDTAAAPDGFSFEQFSKFVAGRLHLLPSFRNRLVEVPLAIDHPQWIPDPNFDLSEHLCHRELDGGATNADVARIVGAIASTPLRRDRPLWELTLIEGVEHGQSAVVLKVHHCIADGGSGLELIAHLLDLEPSPSDTSGPRCNPPDHDVPSRAAAALSATINRVTHPLRPARAAIGVGMALGRIATTSVGRRLAGARTAAHPVNAPRTMFNSSVSAQRSAAFGQASLEPLRAAHQQYDATVNDAVLAACTSGLRRYLIAHGEEPLRPLVCSVPVSTHEQSTSESSNQVSAMFVNLPVNVADPIEQLESIHRSSDDAKDIQHSVGTNIIGDMIELIPGSVLQVATDLFSKAKIANRVAPVHNLVVSNVMGPPFQLYLAGARVTGMYPFGPLMEGAGLNISVLSNNGAMNIGLLACPELVPDLDQLLNEILDSIDQLGDAATAKALSATTDETSPV